MRGQRNSRRTIKNGVDPRRRQVADNPPSQPPDSACFVAGTLVHTKEGLAPIENIRVGDFVLSQPEMKGELAYRRVAETFVHEEKGIYLVDYCVVGSSVDAIDEVTFWDDRDESSLSYLVATGNHPSWVKNVGWTSVESLETNSILELKDGWSAIVLQVRRILRSAISGVGWTPDMDEDFSRKIDLRGDRFVVGEYVRNEIELEADLEIYDSEDAYLRRRVYNFEVEGFHTYYVGKEGVWVHDATG
jgi:hypothetical protein